MTEASFQIPPNLPEASLKAAHEAVRQQASWCPKINEIPHHELLTLLSIGIRAFWTAEGSKPIKLNHAPARKPKDPAQQPSKRTRVLERDKHICYLCNTSISKGDESIDHVIPKARGGRNGMDNLRAAHKHCNYLKGDLTLEEYRAKYARVNRLTLVSS